MFKCTIRISKLPKQSYKEKNSTVIFSFLYCADGRMEVIYTVPHKGKCKAVFRSIESNSALHQHVEFPKT